MPRERGNRPGCVYAEMCIRDRAGAIYIPIDRILNEQWVDEDYDGGLSPDGVHPYESGINLLATEWLKAVEAAR